MYSCKHLEAFKGLLVGVVAINVVVIGCLDEILGYVDRIMLSSNPFSFAGFLMQNGESAVSDSGRPGQYKSS